MKSMYISPDTGNLKIEPMTVLQATGPVTPVDPPSPPSPAPGRMLYV